MCALFGFRILGFRNRLSSPIPFGVCESSVFRALRVLFGSGGADRSARSSSFSGRACFVWRALSDSGFFGLGNARAVQTQFSSTSSGGYAFRGHNKLVFRGLLQAMCKLMLKTGVCPLLAGLQTLSCQAFALTGRSSGTAKMLRILVPSALRATAAPHLER